MRLFAREVMPASDLTSLSLPITSFEKSNPLRDDTLQVLQVRPDLRRPSVISRFLPLRRLSRCAIAHFVDREILRIAFDRHIAARTVDPGHADQRRNVIFVV